MREINCTEDRICHIAPMENILQKGGGGLASAQNEYMIPYPQAIAMVKKAKIYQKGGGGLASAEDGYMMPYSQAALMTKKSAIKRKASQAGKGRRRKPKIISKTSTSKKQTSKKPAPRKQILKKANRKLKKPKSVRKRKCCIEI